MHGSSLSNIAFLAAGKGFTACWKLCLNGKPLLLISSEDVGWFGAQAFMHPTSKTYANAEMALAGDSVTYEQAAEIFKQKTGQTMPTTYGLIARAFLWGTKDLGMMFRWFGTDGFEADIPALRKLHPEMLTFGDWLEQKSSWKK